MGPLSALAQAYDREFQWTLEMPRLGRPYAVRGQFGAAIFPAREIAEFNLKTKYPHIICIQTVERDDEREIRKIWPLNGPVSSATMRSMTRHLVDVGAHPLDIVVATWRKDTNDFVFRTCVEHLLWTADDQDKIDKEASE